MQYRRDKYGRELSVLGFGCMRFTKKGTAIDLEKAEKEIMAAFRAGVNYYDTAYIYPGSEVLLGAAMDACAIALGIMMVSGVFRALKTGSDMARQRQQDLLGTAISPDLYVSDPEKEE